MAAGALLLREALLGQCDECCFRALLPARELSHAMDGSPCVIELRSVRVRTSRAVHGSKCVTSGLQRVQKGIKNLPLAKIRLHASVFTGR